MATLLAELSSIRYVVGIKLLKQSKRTQFTVIQGGCLNTSTQIELKPGCRIKSGMTIEKDYPEVLMINDNSNKLERTGV